MENPKIKTRVVHSQTKSAWNIVGENLGGKYKIARVPYWVLDHQELSDRNRIEAFKHAEFISYCFNQSDSICAVKQPCQTDVMLSLPDIRNKLSPITNLIAMLENGLVKCHVEMHDLVLNEIEQCKKNIAYLSGNGA